MRNLRKNILWVVVLAECTAIFFACLKNFFEEKGFYFSKEMTVQFDPVNLATLIATIFLAIFVARKLNKITEQERVQKNLMIEDLKNFKKDLFKEVKNILNIDPILFQEVVSQIKILRMRFNSIGKLINKFKFVESTTITDEIDSKIRDVRDLLTDTPATSAGSQITVNNGEISIGAERREQVETVLNEFSSLMFELTVMVNNK